MVTTFTRTGASSAGAEADAAAALFAEASLPASACPLGPLGADGADGGNAGALSSEGGRDATVWTRGPPESGTCLVFAHARAVTPKSDAAASWTRGRGQTAWRRMTLSSVHDGGADDSAVERAFVGRFIFLLSRAALVIAVAALAGCGMRAPVPEFTANDARFGRLGGHGDPPSQKEMCGHWTTSVVARDAYALEHISFPETNMQDACFTPVTHTARNVTVDPTPRGCGYPSARVRARLAALADELDRLPDDAPHRLFPCSLTPAQRAAARRQNVHVLRSLAQRTDEFPYSAIVVPGHGVLSQNDTLLARFEPGNVCRELADGDDGRLGALPFRSARAADALRGGVAPVVIVSGGAVHSRVIEAFALMQLLECREKIASDRILVEPCAEHTHTNLRNSGRWLNAMGARAAYLLTDDWLQSEYFQDVSGFEYLLGSVDQRSMRDWGYLVGSWRQASRGIDAGFWFTPYRFWAESRDDVGSFTCVDYP